MALLNALNAIVFDPEAAVVVALPHDQLRESVPLFVAVKVNVGVWLVVFVTVHVVMIGAVTLRVKFIVPVVTLFALSLTTTCRMYVQSQLPVTVGFCIVAPFDHRYDDAPAVALRITLPPMQYVKLPVDVMVGTAGGLLRVTVTKFEVTGQLLTIIVTL